jgi:hypothetical protein
MKEAVSLSRPMNKAVARDFAKDSAPAKAGAEKAPVDDKPGQVVVRPEEKPVRLEEKKAATAIESLTDAKPAAAPAVAAPVARTPSLVESPKPKAAESAVKPSSPAVVMSEAPAAAMPFAARRPASGKRGPSKGDSEDLDQANNRVARGKETPQRFGGSGFGAANGSSSSAGVMVANNSKSGQANRFAIPMAPAATVVRLDVSAQAVENKVFENLLAHHGLGNDQYAMNGAQNFPSANSDLRYRQMERGGRGGGEGQAVRQQDLSAQNSGLAGGAFPVPSLGSAPAGNMSQRQVASQAASPAAQNFAPRVFKGAGHMQAPMAANMQRKIASKAADGQRDDATDLQQQSSKPMVYEFDASPEQVATLIKQIGEDSDSFSSPEIEHMVAPAPNSFAENRSYGANSYSSGTLADRSVEPQQAKADAGSARLASEEAQQRRAAPASSARGAQQTASPAAGAAKQHVVFVLNVVDHVTPAAGRMSPAAAPAKQ